MLWIKAFHIVFVTSWFAGLFYLPRVFVNLAMVPADSHAERERLLLMARKLYRFASLLMIPAVGLGLWLWLSHRELFTGGIGMPATLNGRPIVPHAGQALTEGVVMVGYSPRSTPKVILGVLGRLLEAGGMYYRNGSGAVGLCYVACGRLIGYVEPHINSWDCLGAIAVIEAAGGQVNDVLAGDGLRSGGPIVAGPPAVFEALVEILEG